MIINLHFTAACRPTNVSTWVCNLSKRHSQSLGFTV